MKVSFAAMRVNARMTQKEVAKAIGVSNKTIQNWENNISAPNVLQYESLCKLYRCTKDDIFVPKILAKSEKANV